MVKLCSVNQRRKLSSPKRTHRRVGCKFPLPSPRSSTGVTLCSALPLDPAVFASLIISQFARRSLTLSSFLSHLFDPTCENHSDLFFLHINALRRLLPSLFTMASRHSYGPAATRDSTDEEDRSFISAQRSEKKVALLGTTNFNRVMGFVNIILALVLAVSLALLAGSVTHDRKDAAVASVPYCKCSSAAPA